MPNLNRWLRPYNVQEILCGSCSSTVPTGNTVEVEESTVSNLDSNAIKYDGKVNSKLIFSKVNPFQVIVCSECVSSETAKTSPEKSNEAKTSEKSTPVTPQPNPLGQSSQNDVHSNTILTFSQFITYARTADCSNGNAAGAVSTDESLS